MVFGLVPIFFLVSKERKVHNAKDPPLSRQVFCSFPIIWMLIVWIASFLAMTQSESYARSHSAFSIHNSAFKITSSRPFRRPWASEV